MIGNDIVDLQVASKQNNWQRPGFINKLFSKVEYDYIFNAEDPSQMVWLLWSMKESAYKAYLQKCPKRFFNPKKLECSLISNLKGTVRIHNYEFQTKTEVTDNYIHTVATHNDEGSTLTKCFEIPSIYKAQHDLTNAKLLKNISKMTSTSMELLKIKKDALGIPKIYKEDSLITLSISLSHHGSYGAFSILN
ncbi:MAG: 4-phosphopantetheinyl transferase family protein [Flavobacteriaceae bacterium]|nr:4-phosphopantetheinyl transferase family protein [Flavobacteriaceae bacterium]